MKKQVLSIGLASSLVLMPSMSHVSASQTAGTTADTSLNHPYPNPTKQTEIQQADPLTLTQVLQDIRPNTAARPLNSLIQANEWDKVDHVILDEQVKIAPTSTLDMIQAAKAWQELGVKGEGMLVSIIDTGVNPQHPDFQPPRDKRAAQAKSGSPKKVIPGYNWADRNKITKDVGESQHGVHVAGIVAANGKIKGVAPEAQLLSEKVFSNYQGEMSGLSESILFAITDSVTKKADVINLSLGSSAGYVDDTNTEQYAIKRAVDNGVIVVAAAGNDAYFGSEKVKTENPDYSMVGSPGISPDAFSVASANATTLAGMSFAVTGVSGLDRAVYLTSHQSQGDAIDPAQALTKTYSLVYVGKGKKEDYNINVKDKVVLIERGDISFDEKLRLAKQAGAVGAIIYNNTNGPLIMSGQEMKNIPAVAILKQTGEQIASRLKKGKNVTVTFDGHYAQNPLPYPNGGTISGFTSWGPTPDLQFKPEITAPGGGILSTVYDDDYGVKSGTSMATPHVAGGMALLKQYYIKQGRNLTGRPLVETLKAATMNTAEPIFDPRDVAAISKGSEEKAYPYSPRVQGAGMIQLVRAAKTPVVVTDAKGKAGISLGQVGKTTSFSLFVENKFGKSPITYTLQDEFGVLTDLQHNGQNMLTDVPLQGAKLSFSKAQVTVKPGERQEVKVTLTIPEQADNNIFAEGFIALTPEKADVPKLRVPYYGFYGDWNAPRVMDAPMWEDSSQEKLTGVKTTWYHDKENDKWKFRDYLGVNGIDEHGNVMIDPSHIAFSPNGDGHYDTAAPSITFLRNAKQVSIDIVDQSGKLIHSLVQDQKVSKFDQSKLGIPYYYTEREEWGWDGKAYNPDKGTYEPVADGAYQFVIKAKIDGRHANWQSMTLPIRVDRKAPSLSASLSGNRVNWSSRDKDVQGYLVYVDGKKTGGPYSSASHMTVVNQPNKKITVVAYDYAGNITMAQVNGKSDTTPPFVEFPNDIFEQILVNKQPHVAISGKIAGEDMLDRVTLVINNHTVPVEADGAFSTLLSLPEGLNYVTYSATDVFGNNRQFTQRIIIDSTAPQVMVVNDGTEEAFYDTGTEKMWMPIEISYRDANFKGQLRVNGEIIQSWEEDQIEKMVEKSFTKHVLLNHGENKVLVEGIDEAGNLAFITVNAYVDTHAGTLVLQYGEQRLSYTAKPIPQPSVGFGHAAYEGVIGDGLVIRGRVVAQTPTRLHFYYGDQRLQADFNERGEFQLDLPALKEGKETLTVVATDPLGREAKAQTAVVGKRSKQSPTDKNK
ncbi:S8 family serine peptidase [Brevibacillus dissolubilis]|uniref:S8 family serine peptidase n=1 Tax=Brevibacillus dissolubilis TaxID=1844116 RepID=UPI0011160CB8|nr:S8 family serine peptidase [Brevibacillus dissolubilis]